MSVTWYWEGTSLSLRTRGTLVLGMRFSPTLFGEVMLQHRGESGNVVSLGDKPPPVRFLEVEKGVS